MFIQKPTEHFKIIMNLYYIWLFFVQDSQITPSIFSIIEKNLEVIRMFISWKKKHIIFALTHEEIDADIPTSCICICLMK